MIEKKLQIEMPRLKTGTRHIPGSKLEPDTVLLHFFKVDLEPDTFLKSK